MEENYQYKTKLKNLVICVNSDNEDENSPSSCKSLKILSNTDILSPEDNIIILNEIINEVNNIKAELEIIKQTNNNNRATNENYDVVDTSIQKGTNRKCVIL